MKVHTLLLSPRSLTIVTLSKTKEENCAMKMAKIASVFTYLVLLLLAPLGRCAAAFQPHKLATTTWTRSSPSSPPTTTAERGTFSFPEASSSLRMKKGKKVVAADRMKGHKVGEIKQDWDFALFLVYMTPWRNPNSIFVYMLLTLIALGKYSESHPHVPPV